MKRICVLLGSVLAIVALFPACKSLPKMESPEDCLIVMKTEIVNETQFPPDVRSYYLELSGDYGYVKTGNDYTAFVVREPLVEVAALRTYVSGGAGGDRGRHELGWKLPYHPGHVVILDVVFVQKLTEHGPSTIYTNLEFRRLEDSARAELERKLALDPAFSEWKFDQGGESPAGGALSR